MEVVNILTPRARPIVLAIAGPNGSGKTTLSRALTMVGTYINADDIKKGNGLTDLEAAQQAEALREAVVRNRQSFSFETVLSTERNLLLLKRAQKGGFEVECIYVITQNAGINIARVRERAQSGGHSVPEEKIRSRYFKALDLLPQVVEVCDRIAVYDNTHEFALLLTKMKNRFEFYPNSYWTLKKLKALVNFDQYIQQS